MATATSTKDNRYIYVDGITDESSAAAYAKGTKITGTTLNSGTFTEVMNASVMTAGAGILYLFNTTDAWLDWSFDGGVTVHMSTPPASAISMDLRNWGRKASAGIHVRRESATPTAGFAQADAVF